VPITVLDFFALSAQRRPVFLGASRRTREITRESLERAGVAHLLQSPLGRLSGGELQRVLFALALRDAPDILLLDEPVSGVDVAGRSCSATSSPRCSATPASAFCWRATTCRW